jgi:hypothetical protein
METGGLAGTGSAATGGMFTVVSTFMGKPWQAWSSTTPHNDKMLEIRFMATSS